MADGQSAAFIINTMNRDERMMKEDDDDSLIADKARIDPVNVNEVIKSLTGKSSKKIHPPPNSPQKRKDTLGSLKRKLTRDQIDQINR